MKNNRLPVKVVSFIVVLAMAINLAPSDCSAKAMPKLILIDEAVSLGLENSIALENLRNQLELSKLIENNTGDHKNDLDDASYQLKYAYLQLADGANEIYSSASLLDSAQSALDNGVAPQDITVPFGEGTLTIPKGANMEAFLLAALPGMEQMVPAILQKVTSQIQAEIDSQRQRLNWGKASLESSTREYNDKASQYNSYVGQAMSGISNKLGLSTVTSLDADAMGTLLYTMAVESNKATVYSYNVYKNQIALLIQNSYYNALKEQSLLDVKKQALTMAEKQLEFARISYEVGAKAKDDMLAAKMYHDAVLIEYELQQKECSNALTELKKNMNVPMDTEYALQLSETANHNTVKTEDYDLLKGIESGLENRLEVRTGEAQIAIYSALLSAVEDSSYNTYDNQYREAELLLEKAKTDQKNNRLAVEASIRQSYETMRALKKTLLSTDSMLEAALETAEIAQLKYTEGYGADNALLKQSGLEQMSGTIVEVINAQQNIVELQEKIIELESGYNLARAKYLNDIGILAY